MNPTDLNHLIHQRKTEKVLTDVNTPSQLSDGLLQKNNALVLESIRTAGMAPFHYPRGKEISEPWRAHLLWNDGTNALAQTLSKDWAITTKEPKLLSASNAVALITWLPEAETMPLEQRKLRDTEHIAATGAMIQNLLLLLTAHGLGNYWSSGGVLRTPKALTHLGIPLGEELLGAIFIEYPESTQGTTERKPGALRQKRSHQWIKEL